MTEQIKEYIQKNEFVSARKLIVEMNVVDIANTLEELEIDKLLIVFRLLPKEIAAEVFVYMSKEQQQLIIQGVADKEIKGILDELFLDDTIDIIEEMPANMVKKILKNTSHSKRELINQFLNYPENSAGSIMTIEYADLKKEMTVSKSLEHIKKIGVDKETINTCYVIDKHRKLEGTISLRKLILAEEDVPIEEIMDRNYISIQTNVDQEEIANLFKKYDLLAMPVVDNENRLVGIITIDDIVDIIEQENTEDFQKMAAINPSDQEYLKTNVLQLAKHRVVWLMVLMISATFTGSIIRRYESVLESVVILAAFIPMLMDTGGNAGSQSATLVIRGMALGEIKLKDTLKVFWKELRVSIIVGLSLASINFVRIYYFEKTDLRITITVCVSLFLTVVLAKVVGGILPIFAKKVKLDPAIMASPLITTIVDAVALMAYFSMAAWLLGL